jgi:hypothetical protein
MGLMSIFGRKHKQNYDNYLNRGDCTVFVSQTMKKILENSTLHSLMTFADFFPLFEIQTQCSLPYLSSYHSFVYVSDRILTSDPCCP